ncbi:MAG: hypothetical protein OXF93_03670 [Acidobacteria bacterium]|nr:hypothetical protein [Acidobacteriota bacterium]
MGEVEHGTADVLVGAPGGRRLAVVVVAAVDILDERSAADDIRALGP